MSENQLRQLGRSDLRIAPVVFGAWAIGGWMWGGNDEQDSIGAIHAAIDNGVNLIDTAAIYGMGFSEELVAKALAGRNDKVLIATKCGMRWDDPKQEGAEPWPQKDNAGNDVIIRKNAKPHSIVYECEQSLKRLNRDVIDLYQIHWPDKTTPPEESIKAMEDLKKQGKIRAIGVSNYDAEWIRRASDIAQVDSLQPPYSLLTRKIEKEILPVCIERNISTIVYSPMERGLLTGKVGPERTFGEGDHRAKLPMFSVENRKRVAEKLEQIKPIADKNGASLAQLVINWTYSQPGITGAIVGARNAEQAAHNAGAMRFTLNETELSEIRKAFDPLAK